MPARQPAIQATRCLPAMRDAHMPIAICFRDIASAMHAMRRKMPRRAAEARISSTPMADIIRHFHFSSRHISFSILAFSPAFTFLSLSSFPVDAMLKHHQYMLFHTPPFTRAPLMRCLCAISRFDANASIRYAILLFQRFSYFIFDYFSEFGRRLPFASYIFIFRCRRPSRPTAFRHFFYRSRYTIG
jgi:hypothetical protein